MSDGEPNEEFSDEDMEISMLTKNFNRFLKRKFPSRTRHINKNSESDMKMKGKEVTCYECKK